MSLSSAKLRSLSHKVLNPSECQQLKRAIQAFRENHSIFSFCCSLKDILDTKEKMQLLMVLHSMVPEDLVSDFESLCCIHFDYYKKVLRPKIQEDLLRNQNKSPHKVIDKRPARQTSVVKPAHGTISSSIRGNRDKRRTKSVEGNLDVVHLQEFQRVPGKKDKNGVQEMKERKRSKTAHLELLRLMSTTDEASDSEMTSRSYRRVHSSTENINSIPSHTNNKTRQKELTDNTGQGLQGSKRTGQTVKVRKVKLENRPGESLGFCIRGGKDLRAGIYISSIDSGGQAESKGLMLGERILKVNDTSLKNVTHAEAVVAIKSTTKLSLYLAQCGQMPGTPNDTPRSQTSSHSRIKEDLAANKMRIVLLVADDDGFLGCSIRGGVDYGLPVTVASIDPLSPAHKAGLKRGELVLKVNGEVISEMSHLEVVDLMTSSNVVKMLVMPNEKRVKRSSSSPSSELRRSPRLLQTESNQVRSSTLSTRSSSRASQLPSTPIRIRRRPEDISEFERELYATPPRNTSTPMPNESQRNRNENQNESLFSNDQSLVTSHDHPIPPINFQLSHTTNANTSSESSVENISPPVDPKMKEFENGTIRLNMNGKDKSTLNGAKTIDVSVKGRHSMDKKRRESVKHIFVSQEGLNDKSDGDEIMECDVPDGNRNKSPKPSNRDHDYNVLSSPHGSQSLEVKVSGKVSPLLLPLQNIGVSSDDQTSNLQSNKQKKKSKLSLAARIFSKKQARGSISSGTYSSSESLDMMVEGRQLPSVDGINNNTADWILY